MPLRPLVLALAVLVLVPLPGSHLSRAAETPADIPEWLKAHVGTGEGQIAPVVLERARALYRRKVDEGAVKNPCYFAMDATRPSRDESGKLGRRFYIICEADKSFRATTSGYGDGRKLRRADFSNGRRCAKHFSNAEGSKLTAGGVYMTAEVRETFKGYYLSSGKKMPFVRAFLPFTGEGETANAWERAIGGHQAVGLRQQCRYKDPDSEYKDEEGYVPYGSLVNYTSGRSNGCTTWSPSDAEKIITMVKDNPTTLYIYPEARDIDAVANAVKDKKSLSRAGLYWNATCLDFIGAPKFWPLEMLQPIIDEWRDSLPKGEPRPLSICK
ncbi:MAG: hypothetical protein VX871_04750 [Pseudomonadota bacterium]|nr:hypothetical protein [Pseudomonadota bacterium]